MPPKKRSRRESLVGNKMWISYRLQSLTTKRFILITNKILQGEHLLIRLPKIQEMPEEAQETTIFRTKYPTPQPF